MSLLVDGKLSPDWFSSVCRDGEYVRMDSQYRHFITADATAAAAGKAFKAETGRYHLYVSYACPWAHRTLIYRQIKSLTDIITVSVVHPGMGEHGWKFAPFPGSTEDHVNGFDFMHQVYTLNDPHYSGIITVPVLWDKHDGCIVNNESSEIIRMFNSAFDHLTGNQLDFYPKELRPRIDALNADIYHNINNGVYRCGFATGQKAYERAFDRLFDTLEKVEILLESNRYLTGGRITEADWRLLPTLLRFDPVYFSHFKCNLKRIMDFPNLCNYMRDLYQYPGVSDTFYMDHVKHHYYWSHQHINPTRIVPKGPLLDYMAPHDRDRFDDGAAARD